jgi:hypothetical protein
MVELRPISAHEVAAEIALYWRGCCEPVAKFDRDFVSPTSRLTTIFVIGRQPTMDRDALPAMFA